MINNTAPAKLKYNPFLKTEVEGINIQKEESAKNISEIPKNILK